MEGRCPYREMPTALIQEIPGANFVLQAVALSGVTATAIGYVHRRREPRFEVGEVAAFASAIFLLFAVLLQLVLELV